MFFVLNRDMKSRDKRFWKGAALVSGEMLGTLLLYTSIIAGFFLVTRKRWRRYKPMDVAVFKKLELVDDPGFTRFIERITFLGNHKFLIPANLSVLFYFLFVRKRTWFSIRVISIALSSLGMMLLLKNAFKRNRPDNPLLYAVRGKSFPSGHALMSITFYGLLIYIVQSSVKSNSLRITSIAGLVILIKLIGFSRIFMRVHYTSDVLAGYAIGGGWLAVSLKTLQGLEDFNKKAVVAIPDPQ
jgi:membrane-associated phospholipid phosphatase